MGDTEAWTFDRPAIEDERERAPEAPRGPTKAPRLAEGVELLGRYEGSGFKDPPYLVRRADGQMIQLPQLLFVVAEQLDGRRGLDEIARRTSEAFGRGLAVEDAQLLVEEKLRPLGILAGDGAGPGPGGAEPAPPKADPLLGLKLRTAVVPARAVRAITTLFLPLFAPPVIVAVLAGLVAFDVWFFFVHGLAQSVRELVYQPALLLMVFGLVVVAGALHEIGHATACRYGGATPGVMGAGIYIVWPAFYTDVTDAYRLGKGGRLRTDLGGVYFNAIFILATAGAYFWTGFEPLLVVVFVQHLEILRQLLPILRLDGYLVLSDLTGVPDMFARMKPILLGLLPWRRTDERARELKPWARAVVTMWILAVVPLLALNLLMIVIHAPRIVATGWDSLGALSEKVSGAFGNGEPLRATAGMLQMGALILPAGGIGYTMTRVSRRVVAKGWGRGGPVGRAGLIVATAGVLAFVGATWWPDVDYAPIRPGERWTIQSTVGAVARTTPGRTAIAVDEAQETTGQESAPGTTATPRPTPSPRATPTPTASPTITSVAPAVPVDASPAAPSPSPTKTAAPSPSPSPDASPTPAP